MRQVNFPFGETLEISTTVRDDGSIHNQEIVSSASDALVTFKFDRGSALTPEVLRKLADAIEGTTNANFPGTVDDWDDDEDNQMIQCGICGSPYCSGRCKPHYHPTKRRTNHDEEIPF